MSKCNESQLIKGTAEAWESGLLGRSDEHVRVTSPDVEQAIDEALGLQAISIRLPKTTIALYKKLAELHGVGYQPLMRDAICRWADAEVKQMFAASVKTKPAVRRSAKNEKHEEPKREMRTAA